MSAVVQVGCSNREEGEGNLWLVFMLLDATHCQVTYGIGCRPHSKQ